MNENEAVDGAAEQPVETAPDSAEPSEDNTPAEAADTAGQEIANHSRALQSLRTENKELKEKNKQLLGEMESFRLRTERDKETFRKYAIAEFAEDMLDAADNITAPSKLSRRN